MRLLTAVAIGCLGCFMLAAPASAQADEVASPHAGVQLFSGEHANRIREEARLQEQRAKELDPIIARDRQARHDVEVNWGVLERHARELHAKANDFRSIGQAYPGRDQNELNAFAGELDTYATHDEENARYQHEMAERLDKAIGIEVAARDWHMKHAERLRDWLKSRGV